LARLVAAVQRAARANDRAGADIKLEFGHGQHRYIDIIELKIIGYIRQYG
jgi:hypothetical protein